ncbi:MAG TPA: NAD(P)/FAD-dependent oxidoreductase [Kofleriaceae bacterium]|nr:NAD(P)/FAD-dependent oxidoreductase [Kofleriaceae bacterium]
MARTPLFASLRRALRRAAAAQRGGHSPDQISEHLANLARRGSQARIARPSRRDILRIGGITGAAAAVPFTAFGSAGCGDNVDGTASVAVIGGGAAGLMAARTLLSAGVDVTVYEASSRTGGRMFTRTGLFPDGKVVELGGELVDSGHELMMMLADDLDLTLDDLVADGAGLRADTYHFDGAVVPEATIVNAFTPLAARMAAAVTASDADDAEFDRLDNMSITEWLGGEGMLASSSLIRRILERAYTGEYGLEVDEQSIFNLLYLIDHEEPDPFRIYGDSDERYHIREGSQAIVDGLASPLAGRIELEHELVAIATESDGRPRLTFDAPSGTVEITVDRAVIAIPFTTLRRVDLSASGFSDEKLEMITELGYGTNAKLMMGFDTRPWRTTSMATGSSVSDVGELQATWETSRGYGGTVGVLTNFVGGDRGLAIGNGTAEERAAEALPWLNTVFPGSQAAYIANSAVRQHWPTAPFALGSYACYRPGQAGYSGNEGARDGNFHFCGEHTSIDFQGYMEGAVETGLRAADEIATALGLPLPGLLQARLDHRATSRVGRHVRRRRRRRARRIPA